MAAQIPMSRETFDAVVLGVLQSSSVYKLSGMSEVLAHGKMASWSSVHPARAKSIVSRAELELKVVRTVEAMVELQGSELLIHYPRDTF